MKAAAGTVALALFAATIVAFATARGHTQYPVYDVLDISTCRVDQTLYRARVAQSAFGAIVSGEAAVPDGFAPSRVVVVATNTNGYKVESVGVARSGYAGVQFSAAVPSERLS